MKAQLSLRQTMMMAAASRPAGALASAFSRATASSLVKKGLVKFEDRPSEMICRKTGRRHVLRVYLITQAGREFMESAPAAGAWSNKRAQSEHSMQKLLDEAYKLLRDCLPAVSMEIARSQMTADSGATKAAEDLHNRIVSVIP